VSENIKCVIWTDASEAYDHSVTTTGYVIKDGIFHPPLIGSGTYKVHNSEGEIKAGIESLNALADFFGLIGIDTKEKEVEVKTDFNYLKNLINNKNSYKKNDEKGKLIGELKDAQERFKSVKCDEIERSKNIAHNVCLLAMRELKSKKSENGMIEEFYELYENPENCTVRI